MAKKSQAKRGMKQIKKRHVIHDRVIFVLRNNVFQKSIVLSLIACVIALGFQKFSEVEILPIESVQIEGEFNYLSEQDLKQKALPYVQAGFFSVDLKLIRQILIGLPWVEDVSIRRQWPNELRVRVIEKQPVAFWGEDGLLSSRASLFKPEKIDVNLKLPQIYGPNGQHEFMLQELGRMQAWLTGTQLMISKIKQDARRSWTLYMASGIELRLGRDHQHERLHRFAGIYKQQLKKHTHKIRHIDMRYTNGFAVAWQNQEA